MATPHRLQAAEPGMTTAPQFPQNWSPDDAAVSLSAISLPEL
jgi:hypothetical protein